MTDRIAARSCGPNLEFLTHMCRLKTRQERHEDRSVPDNHSKLVQDSSRTSRLFVKFPLSRAVVHGSSARSKADSSRWYTLSDLMLHSAMVSPVTRLSRKKSSSRLCPRSGVGRVPTLCCRNFGCCSASLPANVLALSDCVAFLPGPHSA